MRPIYYCSFILSVILLLGSFYFSSSTTFNPLLAGITVISILIGFFASLGFISTFSINRVAKIENNHVSNTKTMNIKKFLFIVSLFIIAFGISYSVPSPLSGTIYGWLPLLLFIGSTVLALIIL